MDSKLNLQNYFQRGKTVVLTLRQGEGDEARWADPDTMALLSLMTEHVPDFQNERRRKKDTWTEISGKLMEEGYTWTAEDCRKKWSNLARTFRKIYEQKLDRSVTKRLKWPFFNSILELLSMDGADNLPEATSITQLIAEGPISMEDTDANSSSDMVGVAIDLASVDNNVSGEEITVLNPTNTVEIDHREASTIQNNEYEMDNGRKSANNDSGSPESHKYAQSTPRNFSKPKTGDKSKIKTKAKPNVKRKPTFDASSPDALMQQFITMTQKQNDTLFEQLATFHNNTVQIMQDRNDILRRLCSTLEEEQKCRKSSCDNCERQGINRFQEIGNSGGNDGQQTTSTSQQNTQQNAVITSYQIANNSLASSSESNVGVLNGSITDGVAVVDTDSLQTLISRDGSGGLTFHLDIPNHRATISEDNDNEARVSSDPKGQFRLETIPSDVNLSAFSAALHPTLVSVMPSASNPHRSSLSKSVSVPLHPPTRKIAPRK